MADLQTHFKKFHESIKLKDYEENKDLRDKRDLLVSTLKDKLTQADPSFSSFDQGSYAMHTGIIPRDGDYDIDVGLEFETTSDDYTPVDLKILVRDALKHGQRTVDIRRPCVTVTYFKNGEKDYHVDLAVYAKDSFGNLQIAMGKENSCEENIYWEVSDPKGLKDKINNMFNQGEDRDQARRVVRYLKKWRDNKLSSGKPVSIALTCAVYNWFSPCFQMGKPNDLVALLNLVETMLANFSNGLTILLPVEPYSDLMSKVTSLQMVLFQDALELLRNALLSASADPIEQTACQTLRKQFGDDFPVPDAEETSKQAAAGFSASGASGRHAV